MPPAFLAGYDTEQPMCIEAVRHVVEVHRRFRIPATFFLVGTLVEHNREELKRLLLDDLFEIGNHTYTHFHVESHPPEAGREQVLRTQDLLEEVFGCRPVGFRSPGGMEEGYRGEAERLAIFADLGFQYISSQAWGPNRKMPAPVVPPYTYADDGFGELLEVPVHGWHENLWTKVHPWQDPLGKIVPDAPQTLEDWLAPFLQEMNQVIEESFPYYGPTMHPWSLRRFHPQCRQAERLLSNARDRGMQFMKFSEFAQQWKTSG